MRITPLHGDGMKRGCSHVVVDLPARSACGSRQILLARVGGMADPSIGDGMKRSHCRSETASAIISHESKLRQCRSIDAAAALGHEQVENW